MEWPKVLDDGVAFVEKYYPPSKPIQMVFMFAGEGEYECYIIQILKKKGYNIERCWFVDKEYKSNAPVRKTIEKILNLAPKVTDTGVMSRQHEIITSLKGSANLTKDKLKNIIQAHEFVVSPSFENLSMVMENYVDAVSTRFVVLAINPQIGSDADHREFGSFLRIMKNKFKVPIFASLWKNSQLEAAGRTTIMEKNASLFNGDDLAYSKTFFEQPGGRKKPAGATPKPTSRPKPPKKVKKDVAGRSK